MRAVFTKFLRPNGRFYTNGAHLKRKDPLDPNVVAIDGSQAGARPEKDTNQKPTGRPRVPIDAARVRILASYGLSVEQIASAEQVHPNTIYNNFGEAYRQGKLWGRGLLMQSLAANAIRHNNVQAQIFLAKNWLGYTEKGEMTVRHEHTLVAERVEAMTHEERTRQLGLMLKKFPWLAQGGNPPSTIEGQAENPQGIVTSYQEELATAEPPNVDSADDSKNES